jgi:probable rRNA maturation factor
VTGRGVRVEVANRQRRLRIGERWVVTLVRQACRAIGIDQAEIGVVLVADRAMAAFNKEWLDHEGPTDVITFGLSEPTAASQRWPGVLAGDIVVSTQTAERVAAELGWSPRHETAYYIVHGLLHLAGYDDRSPVARATMRRHERRVMAALGLPSPPHVADHPKTGTSGVSSLR